MYAVQRSSVVSNVSHASASVRILPSSDTVEDPRTKGVVVHSGVLVLVTNHGAGEADGEDYHHRGDGGADFG